MLDFCCEFFSVDFWKKKRPYHHTHHRENVGDNIFIGRERRERERETGASFAIQKKGLDDDDDTRPHVPSQYWREERKRERVPIRRTKKKKRFPRFAKWEKDAPITTTSGFCRQSSSIFAQVFSRRPRPGAVSGRRASRALAFARYIKSQSVLRQRQPVSLVLILRAANNNNNTCIRIILLALLLFFYIHNVNLTICKRRQILLCAFVVLSMLFT